MGRRRNRGGRGGGASDAPRAADAAGRGRPKKRGAKHASPRTAPDGRPEVDRERVCPLLLRVFPRVGGHARESAFATRARLPAREVQIYTWPDATLREVGRCGEGGGGETRSVCVCVCVRPVRLTPPPQLSHPHSCPTSSKKCRPKPPHRPPSSISRSSTQGAQAPPSCDASAACARVAAGVTTASPCAASGFRRGTM